MIPKVTRPIHLCILASHPVQYHSSFYRELATRPELKVDVLYCCRWGLDKYLDPGFGVEFAWDLPLLEGYASEFLGNVSLRAGPGRLLGCINPGVLTRVLRGCYDALLLANWSTVSMWLAWVAARAVGIPVLLRAEGHQLSEAGGLATHVRRAAVREFLSGIDAFLAIGRSNARFWESQGVRAAAVFHSPYAVENARFCSLPPRRKVELRSALGLDPRFPVILFSGKLIERKRPHDLLAAYRRIVTIRRCSLVYVGDGALRKQLEDDCLREGLHDVRFVGFKNQTQIPPYYALGDVLVLPSSVEPWGLVVNEAMASGLAVVASDRVGAAEDLVRHAVNGFIYPVGEIAALTSALLKVVASPETLASMGEASKEIIALWTMESAADGVVNALEWVYRVSRGMRRRWR